MNRRGFLKSLFAAGAVTAAGIVLPKVTYFLPPTQGWQPASGLWYPSTSELLTTYYNMRSLDTLLANTPFLKMYKPVPLSVAGGNTITFYTVNLRAA